MLSEFLMKVKQYFCDHAFLLKDLEKTGIPELPKPTTNSYVEWSHYYRHILDSEGHTKRVKWKCYKCEKIFYAHCGLDIVPEHGFIVGRNAPHDRGWEER